MRVPDSRDEAQSPADGWAQGCYATPRCARAWMFSGGNLLHGAVAAECRQYCPEVAHPGICFSLLSVSSLLGLALLLGCCCGVCGAGGLACLAGRAGVLPIDWGEARPAPRSAARGRLAGYRSD